MSHHAFLYSPIASPLQQSINGECSMKCDTGNTAVATAAIPTVPAKRKRTSESAKLLPRDAQRLFLAPAHWDAVEWVLPLDDTTEPIASSTRIRAVRLLFTVTVDLSIARSIEENIYHASNTRGFAYADKLTQLVYAITLNPTLAHEQRYPHSVLVLLDDKTLSCGTPVEVWWQEYAKQLAYQRMVLAERELYETEEMAHTDNHNAALVCFKCHSKSIETEQKQTRGADEAMTVFCKCRTCDARWRM